MQAYWKAVSKDGSVLPQFENGKEHLFKEIDQDNLFEFQLICDNRLVLSLFPETGVFGINGFLYKTDLSYRQDKLDYKLIYYKKVMQYIGEGTSSSVFYNVGFEVNINGKTHKRIMRVKDYFISLCEPV